MILRRHKHAASAATPQPLLSEIARLEAAGPTDADTLSKLVRLRHRAGIELVRTAVAAGDYPPPAEELPSAVDGLPALTPAELTPGLLRAAILRHGCALIRGLVEHDRAAALADRLRAVFEQPKAAENERAGPEYREFVPEPPYTLIERPWVNRSGGIWLADCPGLVSEVFHLYEQVGLRRMIRDYLGGEPVISVNKSTLRRARAGVSSVDWHQDGAFMGDVRTLNVWLSLSGCGEDAPGLFMVPRRIEEIVPTGTPGAVFDWSVSHAVAEERAGDAGLIAPAFAPGDAVIFDEFFLHATWVTPDMPRTRFALETWFFNPSGFPSQYVPLVL